MRRILVISSLFPNACEKTKGIFVLQQLKALSDLCDLKVIAPVPWVPPLLRIISWFHLARVPGIEKIDGIEVFHPRYLVIPKVGRCLYGFLYFLGILRTTWQLQKYYPCDAIVAYFAYPDGFAGFLLAHLISKPLLIYALGSDINVFTENRLRRRLTKFALEKAQAIISVSDDLKIKMIGFGIDGRKIAVITNGVDKTKFYPEDARACRSVLYLPFDKKILLFIGNLRKVKGVDVLLEAFRHAKESGDLKNVILVLIGQGELGNYLHSKIAAYNLHKDLLMVGVKNHDEIPLWINACDVFCLPSIHEGCPNVILEAMACGKPIVASRVGGVPNLISEGSNGLLVTPGSYAELADALNKSLTLSWDFGKLRSQSALFSWRKNAEMFNILIERYTKEFYENHLSP